MNKLFLLLFIAALTASYAQDKGKIVPDEKGKRNMYVGLGDRSVFKDTSFSTWYGAEYDMYETDTKELEKITPETLKDVKITIVLGTWCSDSKREVPRFIKVLDKAGFEDKNLTLIFIDRDKKNPFGDIEALKVKYVPVIIVYKGEKELGRIVEAPKETLEKDFADLLK